MPLSPSTSVLSGVVTEGLSTTVLPAVSAGLITPIGIGGGYGNRDPGPLIDFDRAHGAELVTTLKTYLQLNGSLVAVAEELSLHRNTVRYRLGQICELTGFDPVATADQVQLWPALSVRQLQ